MQDHPASRKYLSGISCYFPHDLLAVNIIFLSGKFMKSVFVIICFFIFTAQASAMNKPQSATNCHCFRERSFNPQKKFAADEYLLATSFNSFIAANFHISKSQIIMMKMKGAVNPDDLLIALFVARAENADLDSLLAILDNGGTWKQILESEGLQTPGSHRAVFKAIIAEGDNTTAAAELVTDQLLKEFFNISDLEISSLREKGGNGREVTLVHILERQGKVGKKAAEILSMRIKDQMSWGEIAASFGLSPKETGKLLQ